MDQHIVVEKVRSARFFSPAVQALHYRAALGDAARAVREVRDQHEHQKVAGSPNLVHTLLRERLFARLDLWVHPVARVT